MKPATKRRLATFGAGASIGVVLSYFLFQYAAYVEGPRKVTKFEVLISACELKAGDVFEQRCVEERNVAEQFIPPQTIRAENAGLYVGKKLNVDLVKGSAVRTVDFDEEE